LRDYDTGLSSWKKMPAVMIRKVALAQALREVFPDTFQGLYESAETGVETFEGEVVAPTTASRPEAPQNATSGAPEGVGMGAEPADVPISTNRGELLAFATKHLGYKDRYEVVRELGFRDSGEIKDFAEAHKTLLAKWQQKSMSVEQ
jgi:hypothetical protein